MSESLEIVSPWSGEVVLDLPLDDADAIDRRVGRARQAAATWSRTSIAERIALVERFVDVALGQREAIARSVSRQMGKPVSEARGEVGTMVDRARMMMDLAPEALADRSVGIGDGIRRIITREPLGVVLDIAAWNYPLLIAVNVIAPAVLAGNAVVLKHASQTAGVGRWFEEVFREAGAPDGLVTAVVVRGRDAAGLVQHRGIDGVFFTGSTAAGRQVYENVATRPEGFVDVGLELGGKDPAYVRRDAPLDVVVPALAGAAFSNAGQSCCAVERIYVHRSRYEDFVEALAEEARGWTVADPSKDETRLGPVSSPGALDTFEAQVADAVDKGARLLVGGRRLEGKGWAFPATVLADATEDMDLMREETFGPVIGVAPVDGDEEAIARMNDSPYGLTASIWTVDHGAGAELARKVQAGTVFVNRADYVDPALPWTGFRDSGKGVTLSALAFDHLTRARGIHVRPMSLTG